MANYKTGKCDFTTTEWEQIDSSSRDLFSNYLSCGLSNYVENIGFSSGACSWDISCELKGHPTVFELKDRNITSTKFGDVMVEKDKYDNNKKYCPGFVIVAVNVFKDDVIAYNIMTEETMKCSKKLCPATSMLRGASKKMVLKLCATLKQRIKVTMRDGKWISIKHTKEKH